MTTMPRRQALTYYLHTCLYINLNKNRKKENISTKSKVAYVAMYVHRQLSFKDVISPGLICMKKALEAIHSAESAKIKNRFKIRLSRRIDFTTIVIKFTSVTQPDESVLTCHVFGSLWRQQF
jgi:hypothetical protein